MKLVSMHPVVLQWRASVQAHEQALQHAKSQGNVPDEAIALYNLGLLYWQHRQWDKAQNHLTGALMQFRKLSQIQGVLNSLTLIGHAFQAKGQSDQAERHYQEAYELAQQLGSLLGKAQILLSLANMYSTRGQAQYALKAYAAALHNFRALNDRVGEANTLLSRGHHFFHYHDYPEEAYQDYTTALAAFQSLSIHQWQAHAQNALANWHARYGPDGEAEAKYMQAINLFQRLNDPDGEAQTRLNLATLLVSQTRNAEAAQQYEKAVQLFKLAENHEGEACALAAWESAPNVPQPPQPGAKLEAIRTELIALGGKAGLGPEGDWVRESRSPVSEIIPLIQRIVQLAPDTESVLRTLQRRGILQAQSEETGATVAQSLLRILTRPRANGLNPGDVYRCTLERLYKPHSNTQLINLPFRDGSEKAETCVAASYIYVLSLQKPAEFARIIEELTSPELAFTITRTYPDAQHYRARKEFLQGGGFGFREVGKLTLAIIVHPDENAIHRALAEQAHRLYPDYGFDEREKEKRNTRHAVDVLLQAALTNLALKGRYDSAADADREDNIKGVPFGTYGYLAMDQDILNRITGWVQGPAATNDSWMGTKMVMTSPLEAPDAPMV
jgi:tetratricopeptide (TPR) repeat protein